MGIGVVSPNSRLTIDGSVECEEVRVQVANAPEYVFYADYILRPLHEVKDYIIKNSHLPEIPSAEEMELTLGR